MCALPPPKRGGEKKSQVKKKNQKNNGSTKNCKIALPKVCACVAHGKCLSFSFSFSFSFSLSLTLLIFSAPPRQTKRIVRPLVLGTLFRASSFRARYARSNERKRCVASR